MKLMNILNSLTFRYSRQPEFLKLVPERLTADHLRISEKIKVINEASLTDQGAKFFKADKDGIINPRREIEVSSKVESVMQTLNKAHSDQLNKINKQLNRKDAVQFGTTARTTQNENLVRKDYSIHNDVAIAGFTDGVGRRPAQHLLAAILWVLDFEYRKIDRCA